MFKLMIDQQPKSSGYHYVKWESFDKPIKVYLRDCRDFCFDDGDPLWNWGFDEQDDPESVSLGIDKPWMIQWCEVDEFEVVEKAR